MAYDSVLCNGRAGLEGDIENKFQNQKHDLVLEHQETNQHLIL